MLSPRRSELPRRSCDSQASIFPELILPRDSNCRYPSVNGIIRTCRLLLLSAIGVLIAIPAFSWREGAGLPALSYAKTMKGSVPAYERVVVRSDGTGEYNSQSPSEPVLTRTLTLSPPVTHKLFSLAAKLHDFQGVELESHKHVANLGLKIFRYQDGSQVNEVQFNYSLNRTAEELTDLFESVASVERHIVALDYAMRYDPLGLPRQLELIQVDLDNNALVDPQLMAATLDRIVGNSRYMHLAQARAEDILQEIQDKK
jgi:hypothetical protein